MDRNHRSQPQHPLYLGQIQAYQIPVDTIKAFEGDLDINWNQIFSAPTTLAGYGITNAYTKSQVDALVANYLPLAGGTLTGALTATVSPLTLGIAASSFAFQGTSGSGTNVAPGNLSFEAPIGTGTGVGGKIIFKVPVPLGTSGSTAQSLTDILTISSPQQFLVQAQFNANTPASPAMSYGLDSTPKAYIAIAGAANAFVTGSTVGDFILRSEGFRILFTDAGSNIWAQITTTGKFITKASATTAAGLNLPHGAAPTSPANGDMWTTTAGLFVRINGVTKTVTLT